MELDEWKAKYEPRPDSIESFKKRYPVKEDHNILKTTDDFFKKYPVTEGPSELEKQYPTVEGFRQGVMGTAPDEISGSVMDPNRESKVRGAKAGFAVGTALQVLPAAKLTKGLPVGGSIKDVGPATMAEVLKGEPYTLKTLERLPQNKGAIPTQTLKEQLKRADVSKPERDILEPLTMTEGAVKPEDIVSHFKKSTEDFVLSPKHHQEYADYGVDNLRPDALFTEFENAKSPELDRSTDQILPVRTTTWQVPEGVSGSTANHFQDPRYFGHTRAFEEDGVPHVVEVQSDLMQKAKSTMDPETRAKVQKDLDSVVAQKKLVDAWHRRGVTNTVEETQQTIDALRELNPDIDFVLGGHMVPGSMYPENALEGAIKNLSSKDADLRGHAFDQLDSALGHHEDRLRLLRDEHRTKLSEGGPTNDLTPMKKTHQQRLVKEELGMAAKAGQDKVRFATPDTVAKVERWPEPRTNALSRIEKHKADIAELEWQIARYKENIGNASHQGAVDGFSSKVKLAERDIKRHKDIIQNDEEIIKNLGPARFKKEHQGIYDNYKELDKYLRSIGGTSHTDKHGHSWIEVDVKNPNSPVKDGRVPMFAAAPFAMGSATQYNTPNKEAAK